MTIYETVDGTLVRGEPIEPQRVTLHLWTHAVGGVAIGGREVGRCSNLREAERLAQANGYTLRGSARFWDRANGIIVPVLALPADIAADQDEEA